VLIARDHVFVYSTIIYWLAAREAGGAGESV
jgi:hypothetical protein